MRALMLQNSTAWAISVVFRLPNTSRLVELIAGDGSGVAETWIAGGTPRWLCGWFGRHFL